MRRSFLLLAPVLLACTPVAPSQAPSKAPGRYEETLTSAGLERKFILRVPKSYDGKKPVPVVMVLHGWTSSAEQAEVYTRMSEKAEQEGFVAVFPNGLGNPGGQGWNADFIDLSGKKQDDVAFLTSVLDRVEKDVVVDKDREYIVGHSNGAFMANLMGSRLSDRLAAIASMAGTIGLNMEKRIPDPKSSVSVLLLHGKVDKMVSYSAESQALLKCVGAVESAQWWAKQNGCLAKPVTDRQSNGRITVDHYLGGRNETEVALVTVNDGPHDWWGGLGRGQSGPVAIPDYGAPVADLVWQFFKEHPKVRK